MQTARCGLAFGRRPRCTVPLVRPAIRSPAQSAWCVGALLWFALPFYLGLLRALRYCYQPRYAIILVGLVGLLVPGVVSEYAPHFHRILGATAPTALLCALGLDWLWQWRPRGYPVTFIAIGPWLVAFLLTTGTLRSRKLFCALGAARPLLCL
ncbi:MAG: hypothetical protein R2932_33800 [Caldilineaceae bacterium]